MNASGTIFFSISALIYTIIITYLFFSKKKVNKLDNRIFSKLLIISILSMVTELAIIFTANIEGVGEFVQKLFLVFIVIWLSRFMDYTFAITVFDSTISDEENINNYKILYNVFLIINLLCSIAIMFAPIEFNDIGTAKYTTGFSVSIVFAITAAYMLIIFILLATHFHKIKEKRCLPIVILFILLIICAIFQKINPQLLLTNSVFGLVVFLMYNTIENPDLKLISQLELAKQSAEKANRAKSDFLSSMSHEIRTPLNAVIGAAQLLETEKNLTKDGKVALKELSDASNSLLEIGSGILDITQIESGKIDVIEKEYNPIETFDDLYKLFERKIKEKKLKFNVKYAEDIPLALIGDKNKIKQILTNVLSNAVKYTDKGKIDINIKCINENDKCTLIATISDTGRGIRKEMMDKMFEKFSRDEEVTNSTIEGSGLGLAITKSLVDILGGKIVCDSTIGVGTTFTIFIPQKISNVDLEDKNNLKKRKKKNNETINVLIVDDNKMNLNIESRMLSINGVNVDTCISGFECLEKITNGSNYDVIIMDDMMPELSGTETMKKLKFEMNYTNPIIVLTANAKAEDKELYLQEGFDEYLSKPTSKELLYKTVLKHTNKN